MWTQRWLKRCCNLQNFALLCYWLWTSSCLKGRVSFKCSKSTTKTLPKSVKYVKGWIILRKMSGEKGKIFRWWWDGREGGEGGKGWGGVGGLLSRGELFRSNRSGVAVFVGIIQGVIVQGQKPGGNCLWGNFTGGNRPGGQLSRGKLSRGNYPGCKSSGGNCLGGCCPRRN